MALLTLLDFICLLPVQERYHLSQPLKSAQIVPSYSLGCCLPSPCSNRDCEAETTSRSCFSRPRCCQIHNQLRGPSHIAFFLLSYPFVPCSLTVGQGVLGLYRGYFTTLAREIPFSLIQFPLWEFLKKQLATVTGQVLNTQSPLIQNCLCRKLLNPGKPHCVVLLPVGSLLQ